MINYSTENLRARINALTDGRGVDVVYGPVGGPHTEQALWAMAWRGRLVVVGFAAGEIPKIPITLCLLKERTVNGVYWGDSVKQDAQGYYRSIEQLLQCFASGTIKPHISERVPLAEAPRLFDRMAGRQIKDKAIGLPEA